MTRFFLVILLSYSSLSFAATFEAASANYNKKNYPLAYTQFLELAGLGNKDAQAAIGYMHLKGQNAKKDAVEALAWFQLAAEEEKDTKIVNARNSIRKTLTKSQLEWAEQRFVELKKDYGLAEVRERLLPTNKKGGLLGFKLYRSKRKIPPRYPALASRSALNGWVDIDFMVAKDGTTRFHTVINYSDQIFINSALESVQAFLYDPAKLDNQAIDVYGIINRIRYVIEGSKVRHSNIANILDDLKAKAVIGGGKDRYLYASTLGTLGPYMDRKTRATHSGINKWYIRSAVDGYPLAKYRLASRIHYGQNCQIDDYKSQFWLEGAAKDGVTEAQLLLGIEHLSGVRYKKDEKTGLQWIAKAADMGLDHAQLKLSWILATHPNASVRDPQLAKSYFSKISPEEYLDLLSWHETNAAIHAALGDFKHAVKSQKKAIKQAKKHDLPLENFKINLQKYQNNTALSELL